MCTAVPASEGTLRTTTGLIMDEKHIHIKSSSNQNVLVRK